MYDQWTQHETGGIAPWYAFLMLALFCYIATSGFYQTLKDKFKKLEEREFSDKDFKNYTIGFVVSWSLMGLMIWNPQLPKF